MFSTAEQCRIRCPWFQFPFYWTFRTLWLELGGFFTSPKAQAIIFLEVELGSHSPFQPYLKNTGEVLCHHVGRPCLTKRWCGKHAAPPCFLSVPSARGFPSSWCMCGFLDTHRHGHLSQSSFLLHVVLVTERPFTPRARDSHTSWSLDTDLAGWQTRRWNSILLFWYQCFVPDSPVGEQPSSGPLCKVSLDHTF